MSEIYRKFGRTVRYENGMLVRVEEAGEAIESEETFRCQPIGAGSHFAAALDPGAVERTVDIIRAMIDPPLAIERLVVSDGVAEHEFGERRWRETRRRVHLSIARPPLRAIVDLGDFDVSIISDIAQALGSVGPEREAPARISLAPNVTAALLPSLVGVAPPNIRLLQSAGGLDGKGQRVESSELIEPPWPNWYRPSYRTRPVRMPFHLRATCSVTEIDEDLPRAIALLAPPDGLSLRVLCALGDKVFPATVHVTRIDAIAAATHWYPYGAGSFGSEMML